MKKVLFVINTLGGAGAERALLELLKRFTPDQYEVDLYILLEQGELISQVPEYVNILNRNYTAESVLSAEGRKKLNKKVFMRLFTHGALFKNIPYLIKNAVAMLGRKKIYADKLLWRVMSDSGMKLNKSYDMAVAYLEGGSTYFVHDHVTAEKKFTFLHVDYKYAGYTRELDRDCYLDFDRIFTVSGEVKMVFNDVYPECRNKTLVFHNLIDREEICRKAELPGGFSDAYSGKRILTVGRLTAQKAYELAIDAMKLLKDQGIKARWYILGEGELRRSPSTFPPEGRGSPRTGRPPPPARDMPRRPRAAPPARRPPPSAKRRPSWESAAGTPTRTEGGTPCRTPSKARRARRRAPSRRRKPRRARPSIASTAYHRKSNR